MLEKLFMKPSYFLPVLLWIVTLNACKKDTQSLQQVNGKGLFGVWELRAVSGGMVPFNADNYRTGNGSLWRFTQTDFSRIYKDSIYRSGTYSVSVGTGTDLNTGRKIDQFIFNGNPAESFELRNDTLKFYNGAISYDGDIEMYVKIAEK